LAHLGNGLRQQHALGAVRDLRVLDLRLQLLDQVEQLLLRLLVDGDRRLGIRADRNTRAGDVPGVDV
jgi:hypothetical protein